MFCGMKEVPSSPSTSAKLLRQDCREQAMRAAACAWLQASCASLRKASSDGGKVLGTTYY